MMPPALFHFLVLYFPHLLPAAAAQWRARMAAAHSPHAGADAARRSMPPLPCVAACRRCRYFKQQHGGRRREVAAERVRRRGTAAAKALLLLLLMPLRVLLLMLLLMLLLVVAR